MMTTVTASDDTEREYLFYGDVYFKIMAVITAKDQKTYSTKLFALDAFDALIHNRSVEWNGIHPKRIERLTKLIEAELGQNDDNDCYINRVFHHVCISQKWIGIKRMEAIPINLKQSFLTEDGNLSLERLTALFPNAQKIYFLNNKFKLILNECTNLCRSILDFLQKLHANTNVAFLKFESNVQSTSKSSSILRTKMARFDRKYMKIKWKLKYEHELEEKHCISFQKENN